MKTTDWRARASRFGVSPRLEPEESHAIGASRIERDQNYVGRLRFGRRAGACHRTRHKAKKTKQGTDEEHDYEKSIIAGLSPAISG